jgi:hypothetical protein
MRIEAEAEAEIEIEIEIEIVTAIETGNGIEDIVDNVVDSEMFVVDGVERIEFVELEGEWKRRQKSMGSRSRSKLRVMYFEDY